MKYNVWNNFRVGGDVEITYNFGVTGQGYKCFLPYAVQPSNTNIIAISKAQQLNTMSSDCKGYTERWDTKKKSLLRKSQS